MLLVLATIAIVVVMGASFVVSQSTSTGVARNIDRHARARAIAESGVDLALATLRADTAGNWRTTYTHGIWITNQSLDNGTVTIYGYDGVDTDGDGVPDGDGNLADDPSDPITLVAIGSYQGVTHTVRRIVSAEVTGGNGPWSSFALATSLSLVGSAEIDSWNSSEGAYSATRGSEARVITNSTEDGAIALNGSSSIKGDVMIGPGGDLDDVIDAPAWNPNAITGERLVAEETFVLENVTPPSHGGLTSSGNVSYNGSGTINLTSSLRANNFSTGGSKTINLNGNLLIYCDNDFSVGGSSTLNVNGDVVIYCGGDFSVAGSGKVMIISGSLKVYVENDASIVGSGEFNVNTGDPSRLELYALGNGDVSITGSAVIYGRIHAPNSPLSITGSAQLFGTYQGYAASITGSAKFHQDQAELDGGGGGGGGGGTVTYTSAWVETP